MLPAAHRLTGAAQFRQTVRQGSRCGSPALVVHVSTASGAAVPATAPSQVGLVVSKAVGNAVVRNRVKRRLRHLLAELLPAVGPGRSLVVRANPAAAQASYAELRRALERCLRRALETRDVTT